MDFAFGHQLSLYVPYIVLVEALARYHVQLQLQWPWHQHILYTVSKANN